jgi:hypothetical protein
MLLKRAFLTGGRGVIMVSYSLHRTSVPGSVSDPDLIRSVDPDPGGQKVPGTVPRKIEKSSEISCFEVLHVLF